MTYENITAQVVSADIRPAIIKSTDPLAVSLKIKSCRKRGPGYCKLNNTYLNGKEFFYLISSVIDSCSQLNIQSAQIKWEICKIEIKSKSIDYAKFKARERNNTLHQLEKELSNLYSIQQNGNKQTRMNELELEISQLYDFKAKGAQIRSRTHVLEEGEKNTKYLVNLESRDNIEN